MKILVIADVEEAWLEDHYDRKRMEGVELIISCGDLPARYLEHVVTMANVPLVYVWGNHDMGYVAHPPQGCISIEGQLRDYKGVRIMGVGGSIKYNERVFGFTEKEMRRRMGKLALLARATGGVDILVTHAPIRGFGDMEDLPHRGFESFDYYVDKLKPAFMFHGHIHMNYGRVERVRKHPCGTTVVNACGAQILDIPDDVFPQRGKREPLLIPTI